MLKKKIWTIKKNIYNFLPKKLSKSSKKYGLGIRDKPIPDPGVKKAPDTASGSATLEERKEGRKEGREEERKERKKERRKEKSIYN
jgi:hypothetical protein